MQNNTIDFSKYNTKWAFINFNECVSDNGNEQYSIKLLHDKTYYLYQNNIFIKSSMDCNELFLYVDTKLTEKIVCIYHKNCPDGFASAWVLNNYYKKLNQIVEFIPLSYGMELPIIDNSRIFLLDFSFDSIEIYEQYLENNIDITIIDHHKKAIDLLRDYQHPKLNQYLNNNYSGCVLTWSYFNNPDENIPQILKYIQDRDLYLFELPMSKESLCVIDLWEFDFDIWDKNSDWFEKNTNSVVKKGSDILEYKQKLINKMYKKRHYCSFFGHDNILCVNSNLPEIDSEVAEMLYNDDLGRFSIIYHIGTDGIKISLRSKSLVGMDVNEIAKRFCGGGHKHASGCSIPWNNLAFIKCFLESFKPIER